MFDPLPDPVSPTTWISQLWIDNSAPKQSFLKSSAYQRFQSMPSPYSSSEDQENIGCSLLRPRTDPDAPKSFSEDDESSQESADSGCIEDMPTSFSFPKPVEPAPRQITAKPTFRRSLKSPLGDSTNSPIHHKSDNAMSPKFRCSSRTLSFSPSPKSFSPSAKDSSPIQLKASSLTFSPAGDDGDDGFMDMVDMDLAESPISRPTGFCSLLSAPINAEHHNQAKPKCPKRGLFRSPSTPGHLDRSQSFTLRSRLSKRNEPCKESCLENESPTSYRQPCKRRKSILKTESPLMSKTKLRHTQSDLSPSQKPSPPQVRFHRSYSCADATDHTAKVKTILDQNSEGKEELVGDYSRSYALPTVAGKHQDLKSITAETLADVMDNKYSEVISEATIIDCRYPYEYNGGHITGGRNLYTKDSVLEAFMAAGQPEKYQVDTEGKRKVLIFHCEFSSERAPKMARFLRNMDRDANEYPALHYPEVYILHNGYKEFFAKQKTECTPQSYLPMLHSDYNKDLKHFRVKSKSWAGEASSRSRSSRSLFA